jgi:hypothetical protein
MGTARSADEFRVTGALENENTLMTDYWLDFVAARGGTCGFPPDSFALQDIRTRLQQFSQKIHGLLESQAEIRCTLDITCQEIQRPSGSEIDFEGAGFPRYDPALSNQETKRCNELQPHMENRSPGLFARSRLFFSSLLRGSSLF